MLAVVVALAAANLAFRGSCRAAVPRPRLGLQVAVDLAALTALLHFSGGLSNPFHVLFAFHVVTAAKVLDRRSALVVTAASCAALTLPALAEVLGLAPALPLRGTVAASELSGAVVLGELLASNVLLVGTAWLALRAVERSRAAEAALAEAAREAATERQRLQAVVTAAEVGMRLLAKDRTILWQNRTVEEWFGVTDLAGHGCFKALGEPVLGCATCLCTEVVRTSEPTRGERVLKGRHFVVTANPVLDDAGEVQQVVEIVRDVTEERETAAQLVQAAKLAAIGELAASVAHEVNNPTGIILGKVRLLLAGSRAELPEKVVTELEKVDRQVVRIADVTRRLLDFARPSPPTHRPAVDLNGVVDDCLALADDRIGREGIRVETARAAELPRVVADPQELRLALLNVLNNAVDAMPRGGVLGVATVARPEGRVAVEVRDTGSGIAPDSLPRIFEPFYSTKGPRGTGLGLAITRRILRENGGDVEVETDVGRGSCFRLVLHGRRP